MVLLQPPDVQPPRGLEDLMPEDLDDEKMHRN